MVPKIGGYQRRSWGGQVSFSSRPRSEPKKDKVPVAQIEPRMGNLKKKNDLYDSQQLKKQEVSQGWTILKKERSARTNDREKAGVGRRS